MTEHLDGDRSGVVAVALGVCEVDLGTRSLAELANESIAAEGVASHPTTVPGFPTSCERITIPVTKQSREGMGRTGTRIDSDA